MSLHYFEQLVFCTFPEITRSDSLRSIRSTFAVDDETISDNKKIPMNQKRPPRVNFALDDQNEVFYRTHLQTAQDSQALWYSPREIAQFRRDTNALAESIFESTDPAHHEWFMTILDAYMGLNEAADDAGMDQIMQACSQTKVMDPDLVGFDKYVLRKVVSREERAERRDYMYRNICTSSCRLTQFHCQTSRRVSRPDGMLARLVASMYGQ